MDNNPTPNSTAWIRWAVGIALMVLFQLATIAYFAGTLTNKLEANEKRLVTVETDRVTRVEFIDMKSDVKDVKADVKELLKQKR